MAYGVRAIPELRELWQPAQADGGGVLLVTSGLLCELFQRGFCEYGKKHNVAVDWLNIYIKGSGFERYLVRHNILRYKERKIAALSGWLAGNIQNYDKVLFINLDEAGVQLAFDNKGQLEKKGYLFLVDIIRHFDKIDRFCDCLMMFKDAFTFEYADTGKYLREYGAEVKYVTLGSSYCPQPSAAAYEYDISLVLSGKNRKRLKYLDCIADWCLNNGTKLFVAGSFWPRRHLLPRVIGALKFRFKHPTLYRYVENRHIAPEEVAHVYNHSRICPNINTEGHLSFNLRGFDVMLSNSLLITDPEDLSGLKLEAGKHFVMAEDADDMLKKIGYFLEHEKERREIAEAGFEAATKQYSFVDTLDRIFES